MVANHVKLTPNAHSVVPGQCTFSMQWRDADRERLDKMEVIIRKTAEDIAAEMQIGVKFGPLLGIEPTLMDCNLQKNTRTFGFFVHLLIRMYHAFYIYNSHYHYKTRAMSKCIPAAPAV